jgi:hypothetical protein
MISHILFCIIYYFKLYQISNIAFLFLYLSEFYKITNLKYSQPCMLYLTCSNLGCILNNGLNLGCILNNGLNLCILTCSNIEFECSQSITVIERLNIIPSTLQILGS